VKEKVLIHGRIVKVGEEKKPMRMYSSSRTLRRKAKGETSEATHVVKGTTEVLHSPFPFRASHKLHLFNKALASPLFRAKA
jgi:hypothetical protein